MGPPQLEEGKVLKVYHVVNRPLVRQSNGSFQLFFGEQGRVIRCVIIDVTGCSVVSEETTIWL